MIVELIIDFFFPEIAKEVEKKEAEEYKAANPVEKKKEVPLYKQRMFGSPVYLDDIKREHGYYRVAMVERHLAHKAGPHRNSQVDYRKEMLRLLNEDWNTVREWADYYANVEKEEGHYRPHL